MKRILVVLVAAFLLLAPAAMAKGPHVIMTTAKEAVQPGKPWETTLEFNEFSHAPRPVMTARSGGRSVNAAVVPADASMDSATGFKTRLTFPVKGRWSILVTSGKQRFKLPAINVGTNEIVLSYVAFAEGSMAAKQGGSGVYVDDPAADSPDDPLPPEVISYADAHAEADDDRNGPEAWLFLPLAGVVLAGAGVLTLRRRR